MHSYRFKLPTPKSILGLPIGQHISIAATLPQPDGASKEIVRSYTPISGDHQPGYFDLLIKSYPTGNISKHMASMVIGQTLKVRGPKGAMVYTPNMVRAFGMIAGGTGITPMLQIIRAVIRGRPTGDKTQIDLIFANVNKEDILLKEDLDTLAKQDAGFRVHYVLNNPPEKWEGGVGFVTPEMITVCYSNLSICGYCQSQTSPSTSRTFILIIYHRTGSPNPPPTSSSSSVVLHP
jgi:cytochrome-b5 reductase